VITEVELPEIALSASWSYNGSLFVVSCKDKKIRIIEPRGGTVVQVDRYFSVVQVDRFLSVIYICRVPTVIQVHSVLTVFQVCRVLPLT